MDVIITILLLIVCFIMGALAGRQVTENRWQKETIERGLSEYNNQTGKWQWKEQEPTEDTKNLAEHEPAQNDK